MNDIIISASIVTHVGSFCLGMIFLAALIAIAVLLVNKRANRDEHA